MNVMKKLFALVLALTLVLGLSLPAFAAEGDEPVPEAPKTTTITIAGVTNHDFVGYELMSVTTKESSSGAASELKYGYSVNDKYKQHIIDTLNQDVNQVTSGSEFLADDANDTKIIDAISKLQATLDRNYAYTSERNRKTSAYFAAKLYDRIQADETITPDASWNNSETVTVEQGYWLIIDVTDINGKENEMNSMALLDTAARDTITINAKAYATTSDKYVDDENDSIHGTNGSGETVNNNTSEDGLVGWEVADHDIDDVIPYSIQGFLADDAGQYDYYSFRIQDTMSKGLTLVEETTGEHKMTMFINEAEKTLAKKGTEAAANAQFVYELETLADGSTVMNVYPNYGYTKQDGTEVEASKDNGGDILKTFPEGTKVDSINRASYDLRYFCVLNENAVMGETGNPNTSVVYISNDPNSDSIGHTVEQETIVYTYEIQIYKVDEDNNPLAGANFDLYKFIGKQGGNREDIPSDDSWVHGGQANTWGVWEKVADKPNKISEDGTLFTFTGLDAGYYKLVETVTPDGYNKIDDIIFELEATHTTTLNGGETLTYIGTRPILNSHQVMEGSVETGVIGITIINHSGTELPGTGGMGTTLFYVIGATLALGAAVVLITKRRMNIQ